MALGAIPVVVNAADVQATSVDLSVTAEDGSQKIEKEVGLLLPGTYKLRGNLVSRLYKVTISIGGKSKTFEPDPDNDIDIYGDPTAPNADLFEFTLTAPTTVKMEADSESDDVGSRFTLGSVVLQLSFDFAGAKTALTNAANALETTNMAFYPYDATADKAAKSTILNTITAIAESYDDYKDQKLYDLPNSPIMGEINALATTIASHQNLQAFNDVNDQISLIKGKYNDAKAAIEPQLKDAAQYLLEPATEDLNGINNRITNATQKNYDAKVAGEAVFKKNDNWGLIPTESEISALITKYIGETDQRTQAKTNKDAYAALWAQYTTLQGNLDAVVEIHESLKPSFAEERGIAQNAITAIMNKVKGVYNKEAQLDLDITADVSTAQGMINTLEGKVNTANAEYTANANSEAAIAAVQGKLTAAMIGVDAKASADGQYKAKDFYTKYVTDVQAEITKLSTDAAQAYKVDGTGSAQTYYDGLATKIATIEGEITDYQTNAIAAVDHYDALQDAITSYQGKLDAARAIYSGKEYYDVEGANYDFKFAFDKLQKDINDIQADINNAKAKVGVDHWTAMLGIGTRALFPKTFASVAELDGQSVALVNIADGKAIYGTNNQNLDFSSFEKSFKAVNSGYVFKIEASAVSGAYRLRLQTPSGDNYYYAPGWNSDGLCYLNTQPVSGTVSFVASYVGAGEGKDIVNGAAWNIEYVAGKGFTIKNVGTGKYLKDSSNAKYDEPTYFNLSTVCANPENSIESKIIALVNRETNADNNWAADGLTGGSVKDLQDKIDAFKAKYTAANLGTEFIYYDGAESGIQNALNTIKTNIANADKNKPATAEAIVGFSKSVDELAVQQEDLEKAAKVIFDGVTANTTLQTTLNDEVSELDGKITTFRTNYGMSGTFNPSILDNSFNDVKGVEDAIKNELDNASTAINNVVPTNVAVEDKSGVVSIDNWKTDVQGGNFQKWADDPTYFEKWDGSNNVNGNLLYQSIEVPNGVYTVELLAASDQSNKAEAMDVVYLYANDIKLWIPSKPGNNAKNVSYTLNNVIVKDGTLRFGLYKVKEGAKWHTIKLASLTRHSTTANADALAAQKVAMEGNGADVKGLIARQSTLETQANAIKEAVAAINTLSYEGLKNLEGVTDANGDYDNVAAKKSLTPAEDWYIFKTGLANDKTFEARKQKALNDEAAMREAIKTAYNAGNGDFEGIWNKETKSFGNYKVSDIQDAIDLIKTDAGTELANWNAYNTTVNPHVDNVTTAINEALTKDTDDDGTTDLEEKAGTNGKTGAEFATALTYYQGVLGGYTTDKNTILANMKTSLNARTAVADKGDDYSGYVMMLKALKNKANAVLDDAADNFAKYTAQKTGEFGYQKTQALWNEVYTDIAARDKSSKRQEWLDALDAIQVKLTAATDSVELNYPLGKSVAEEKDFAAIQTRIKDVKAQQADSYNEIVAQDNADAHDAFVKAIGRATTAYQDAVKDRAKYSSTNPAIEAAVTGAAAALDAILYSCPTDIETLTAAENAAFTADENQSPNVYDVSKFIAEYDAQDNLIGGARYYEKIITDALTTFKDDVTAAIDGFWDSPTYKQAYDQKVADAKNDITNYSDEAKANAFNDVETLIAQGNAGVTNMILSDVEEAIAGLADIDVKLAADKDAAAEKDITPRVTAAKQKYAEVKGFIEEAEIADDVTDAKATQLQNLENAYKTIIGTQTVVGAENMPRTFDNRDNIKQILDQFVANAESYKGEVQTAIDNDEANTEAYEEMVGVIGDVSEKLTDAENAAKPYKYKNEHLFDSQNTVLGNIKQHVEQYKTSGTAVSHKAYVMGALNILKNNYQTTNSIEKELYDAFGTEKTGLGADITELKNQYNAYVAAHGLDDTANAFKTAIDDLAAQLVAIAVKDLNTPADGIQFDEIKAATAELILLQKAIADKETELLEANESTANAEVLADFTDQLDKLAAKATLEGYDEWVGNQPVDDNDVNSPKISEAITEIQGLIADLQDAITAEPNISFYKKQYQDQITAIKDALDPVVTQINAKQDQYTANATAYAALSEKIDELQGKVDAAKTKVGDYEFNGVDYNYIYYFEQYNNPNDENELTGGLQKTINEKKAQIEADNTAVALNANSNLGNLEATVNSTVKNYLDRSAYRELVSQESVLINNLGNAIDIANHEGVQKYSYALWQRLILEKNRINGDINKFDYDIWNSYQTRKSTPSEDYTGYSWDLDDNNNYIVKDRTSDADYEAQMQTVAAIQAEIDDLATAVDNLDLLGDANVDGRVNVLDYQKVLNMILDPTLQPADDTDLFVNIDINQSDIIEVGDLTAIVNYILTGQWGGKLVDGDYVPFAAARGEKIEGESLSMTRETNRIAINLANVSDYTAFQLDLVLPEGMKMVGAELSNRAGESHKLYSRAQLDGSIRMVASSVTGEAFSGNDGAVLYINVEGTGTPELMNILFSDVNAVTRSFAIGDATGIDTMSTFEALKQKVYDLGGRVKNGLKKGINIIRRADGSTEKVVK